MTTLQNLIDACEADLADSGNATWAAADVERWCKDAIKDYGQHFRMRKTVTVAMADDDHDYVLSVDDFLDVISVEYPTGEDPPELLSRRYFRRDDFYNRDGYFDIDPDPSETAGPVLYISANPSSGQSAKVTYDASHAVPAATSSTLTVPIYHEPILRQFVTWKALQQLEHTEEASPTSNSSLLMSQLAQNADRARRAYVDLLSKAYFAQNNARIVSWSGQSEETSQIY